MQSVLPQATIGRGLPAFTAIFASCMVPTIMQTLTTKRKATTTTLKTGAGALTACV
jgi:hypothetical protein